MFDSLVNFFHVILYQPLFNLLVLLYNYIPGHDFGIAIIFLTVIIRILLFPISLKAVKSQNAMQKMQPKIQEIQQKYKDNKEKQGVELLNLYKSEKINPFSGLFLAFVQLPILIALYRVFWQGLNPKELAGLYSFVFNPGQISSLFLNFIDLSKPNFLFAVFAGLVQYFQTKMLIPKSNFNKKEGPDLSQIMQKQMMFFLPGFTIIILLGLPSALGLYWTVSGIFSIAQQYFFLKNNKEEAKNLK